MADYRSTVKVYRKGKPARNVEVSLRFGMLSGAARGRTGSNGVAVINHASKGQVEVYIEGKKAGKMFTPGNESFNI